MNNPLRQLTINREATVNPATPNYKQIRLRLSILLFLLFLGLITWQSWQWWSWVTTPVLTVKASKTDTTVQFQILPGTSVSEIGEDLEAAGLIRSATAWVIWARWLNLRERIFPDQKGAFQSGSFELSPTLSMAEIAERIWQGNVVQQRVLIPEGWTIQQMADYFQSLGLLERDKFLQASKKPPFELYSWLPKGLPHLEGFLYPDTYYLPNDSIKAETIIKLMLDRFEQVALPIYQKQRQQSPFSLLEWVTLSSIVEKESVVETERTKIAGVFTNRLQQQIPLGADPTVEYGLKIRQTPDQPLTLQQVNTPSPYNTYLNQGLPPTPIASPGQASLEAALQPEDTDFLYFVARYDGTHIFSRTLVEHEAAQEAIRSERESRPTDS